MRSSRSALLVAALLVAALLGACSGGSGHSVLLITLDTVRSDVLGAYGLSPSVTPNLDELAGQGIVFERAYTVAPLTLPAHASMLTGLYPPRHGVRDNGVTALPESAVTLAERARSAGYQTTAILGSVVLDQGFGLEQGFERYEAPARRFFGENTMGYAERPAAEVASLAETWLKARDRERPFFLWAHLWDPHSPYSPSAEMKRRAGNNDYLGEIAACDQAVGRLLAALRAEELEDSTLVIVVADHGESFAEHDEVSHGPFVWNTTLHVPLILRRPDGARAGERVTGAASVVDVYATALEAMGLAVDERERPDGVSLYAEAPRAGRGTYFESYYGYLNFGWHPLTGWTDGQVKYVHAPTSRLFELGPDQREQQDRLGERAPQVAEFRGAILEVAGGPVLARDAEGIDPGLKRSLQALGYAAMAGDGTSVPAPLAELDLPDPHERTQELLEFQRAEGLLASQKFEESEALLRNLIERYPENGFVWNRLALCLMRMNRHREAIAPLEHVLAHTTPNADTWSYMGACQLVAGDTEKALGAFTRAVELDPNHVQALGGLIHLMESAGLGNQAAPFKRRFQAVQSRP